MSGARVVDAHGQELSISALVALAELQISELSDNQVASRIAVTDASPAFITVAECDRETDQPRHEI